MRVVIIGIGNELRADDAFGLEVVKILRKQIKDEDVLLICAEDVPENFLEKIENFNPDLTIIIDTVNWNEDIGKVKVGEVIDLKEKPFSTHKPTSLLIHYLKKKTQTKVYLVGVKPKTTQFGRKMSKEVNSSVAEAVEKVKNLLKR